MIRCAVVGVGGYGWTLVHSIERASEQFDCQLVAAADLNLPHLPDRRAHLLEAGVELFDDALEMYRRLRGHADIIYIATGIASHRFLTVQAARAGFHVHLEKPAAATVQEVDEMLDVLDETGRLCLVGFQAVHGEDIAGVKRRIVEGALGEVQSVSCHACWPRKTRYYERNDWAGRLRSGEHWILDGPAVNALAHQINNMLYWASASPSCATPSAVRAELYAAGPVESHNTAAIEIHTQEGPTVHFLASHATAGLDGPVIRLNATGGTVTWRMHEAAHVQYADGREETFAHDPMQHVKMIANLVGAVADGGKTPLAAPLSESRKNIAALNAAHESSGRIHRIADEYIDYRDWDTPQGQAVVPGLEDLLRRAADACCLLSDLPDAPAWTRATQPFDLEGYRQFPSRFETRTSATV